jgi:hypothetical protein
MNIANLKETMNTILVNAVSVELFKFCYTVEYKVCIDFKSQKKIFSVILLPVQERPTVRFIDDCVVYY